jgi:hypothetical protein
MLTFVLSFVVRLCTVDDDTAFFLAVSDSQQSGGGVGMQSSPAVTPSPQFGNSAAMAGKRTVPDSGFGYQQQMQHQQQQQQQQFGGTDAPVSCMQTPHSMYALAHLRAHPAARPAYQPAQQQSYGGTPPDKRPRFDA